MSSRISRVINSLLSLTSLGLVVGYNSLVNCDASQPYQLGFQDPATPIMEGVINFHNDLMIVVVSVGIFVAYMLASTVINFEESVNPIPNRVQHGTRLEIIWTITPALILMAVAVPSFALLYSVDEIIDPEMTGLSKYSKETPPIITIIGLPPAGGWVTLNSIIKPTPKPTANGIMTYKGSGMKCKKIIPTKAVKRCPKKTFLGWAKGLSG